MKDIKKLLQERVVVIDGAMGTEIQKKRYPLTYGVNTRGVMNY